MNPPTSVVEHIDTGGSMMESASPAAPQSWLRRNWPLLAVLGLAWAAFGQTLGFPLLNWDDPFYVTQNPLVVHPLANGWITMLTTPEQGYPIPVTVLSYAAEHALFGFNATAFHATNVLLHSLAIVLVYGVGIRLGLRRPLAALAAGLYGVHPVLVEPVSWVTGRKDLLAIALLLGALWVLLGPGDRRDQSPQTDPPSPLRWAAVLALSTLAMLAKPSAVAAPVLVYLLARHAPHTRSLSRTRLSLMLAPIALLAAGLVVAGVVGLRRIGDLPPRTLGTASWDVLGATALSVKNLVAPGNLMAAYYRVPGDPSLPLIVAVWAGLLGLAWLVWRKGTGLVRLGCLFALVAFLPASNLIHLRRFVADSYVVLPLVGLVWAGAAALQAHWPERLRRAGHLLAPLTLLVLAALSFMQAQRWSDSRRLWVPVLERYPMRPEPYGLLGRAELAAGQDQRAVQLFVQQAERFPKWNNDLPDQAWAYAQRGDSAHAYALLERGVKLEQPVTVQHYLLVLIRSGKPPPGGHRDVVKHAFQQGLPRLKKVVRNPRVFLRLARILRELNLPQLAQQAEAWARHLQRDNAGPAGPSPRVPPPR